MKTTRKRAISFVAFLFLTIIFTLKADAAVYTVTNTGDVGEGSLRAAIDTANETTDADTINFNIADCPMGVCTINLSGQLTIGSAASSGSLSIFNSTGASRLSVRGISVFPGRRRILEVSGGGNLTVEGVTFAGGGTYLADGGAIVNGGSLTLKSSVVRDSVVTGGGAELARGGGIFNAPSGTLTLLGTTVSGNLVESPYGGGGIYNAGGTVSITNSNVTNNTVDSVQSAGGGINSAGGTLTITGSSVNANSNVGNGGGIYCGGCALPITNSNINGNTSESSGAAIQLESATANITNSFISDNTAALDGGGINALGGNLTLSGATVGGNRATQGGGIYIGSGGNATIRDSLIDNNSQPGDAFGFGAGISNLDGTVTLVNSTVSRNQSSNYPGGGIANFGEMSIINSTVSRNNVQFEFGSAAGIYNGSTLSLRNSIVAGNTAADFPDIYSSDGLTSKGNNLIGNADTGGSVAWQSSDILNQSPRLAPLGNYGGATQTFALTNNSLALNAGNNCVITANGCGDNNPAIPTDARGASRVGAVDIGAFELNSTTNGGTFRAVTRDGKVTLPFSYLITQDSGNFTYSVTAGSLPPGLSLTNILPPPPDKTPRSTAKGAFLVPQAGAYVITGTPTMGGTFDYTITATDGTNSVSTNYRTTILPAPTAAAVSISGRVTLGKGARAARAIVSLTDASGTVKTALANPFGYYRFENIAVGQTVTVQVSAKNVWFMSQVVNVTGDVENLDFTGQ